MPRKYYRRVFRKKNKYSHETVNIQTNNVSDWTVVPATTEFTMDSYQFSIPIIRPTDVEGMRKIKNISISFSAGTDLVLYYYIVYVPQGYEPQAIQVPGASQAVVGYSANQFIMGSGVLDFTGGPLRVRSPLSRNLNSGDSISLILASPFTSSNSVMAQISYAITLQ